MLKVFFQFFDNTMWEWAVLNLCPSWFGCAPLLSCYGAAQWVLLHTQWSSHPVTFRHPSPWQEGDFQQVQQLSQWPGSCWVPRHLASFSQSSVASLIGRFLARFMSTPPPKLMGSLGLLSLTRIKAQIWINFIS